MTFREAAAEYQGWLRKQPGGRLNLAARRRRGEYQIEKYVLPHVGLKTVAEVAAGVDELEAVISATNEKQAGDEWVAGIIQATWAIIRHAQK